MHFACRPNNPFTSAKTVVGFPLGKSEATK